MTNVPYKDKDDRSINMGLNVLDPFSGIPFDTSPQCRMKLNQNFELPLFLIFIVVPFNWCVLSSRPFGVIASSADLVVFTGKNTTVEWDDGENWK